MINESQVKRYCSEDISKIENYEAAIADQTQTWDCHHRRETIYTREGLIEIGEYYKRPAMELILLTKAQHRHIHFKNRQYSKESIEKMRKAKLGKHHSKGSIEKMCKAKKGKNNPAYGMHWWNNGAKSIRAKECPVGFKKGRL